MVNYMDLSGVLGTSWTLPSSGIAGKSLSGSVSVAVSNLGNVALPSGQQVNIQFIARDTTTPSNPDILLATLANQSVSALAANGSMAFTASVSRPTGLPADTYQVLATITPVQPLTESNTADNTVTSPTRTITVAPAFVNLAGTLSSPSWNALPSSLIAGKALSGSISVVVSNLGDVALPTGQQVNIQFVAHDVTNSANPDIVLATLSNQSVSALAANGAKTFSATISRPAGLPADTYQVLAEIIPVQPLTESNTSDNVVTSPTKTIVAAPAFWKLTGQFGAPYSPLPTSVIAGKSFSGNVSVVVSNLGNVALPSGQQVNIQFIARDTTTPSNPDIILATLANQSVSALAANGSKTFTASVSRPAGLAADTYQVLANILPVQPPTGTSSVVGSVTSPTKTITATPAFVDLAGTFGPTWSWTLPSSIVAGQSLKGSISVVVSNLGNVALPTGQTVNIQFVAEDTTTPSNPAITLATLSNQSVSALAAGGTKTFSGTVSLSTGLPADSYQIVATISPVQALTESSTSDNTVTSPTKTILVS